MSRIACRKRCLLLAAVTLLLLDGCGKKAPVIRTPPAVPVVRVGLARMVSKVRISSTGAMRLAIRSGGKQSSVTIAGTKRVHLIAREDTIRVVGKGGRSIVAGRRLAVFPVGKGTFLKLGGKEYRGSFEVFSASSSMTVVNVLDVESYLRGVVAPEIGHLSRSGLEALKAQAVAARTYVLSHLGKRPDAGFDVLPTTEDQVYFGVAAEEPLADEAIAETRGRVITYKGKLITAYYSSCCGGRTAGVEDGWERDPEPYLVPRWDRVSKSHGYLCRNSPNFRWKAKWSSEELKRQITAFVQSRGGLAKGEDLGEILDVKIAKKGKSKRVIKLEIETTRRTIVLDRYEIRQALRPPGRKGGALRSTLFNLEVKRRRGKVKGIVIKGGGYGHGVGMCQWGAISMSRLGYGYEEILKHYYKDVDIVKKY